VVITETDRMDQSGATSPESDKITQLEARTHAYGSRKRIYMECTVSTEDGRTWQHISRDLKAGTSSGRARKTKNSPGGPTLGAIKSRRVTGAGQHRKGPRHPTLAARHLGCSGSGPIGSYA